MNTGLSSEKSKLGLLTAILKPLMFQVSSSENIDTILFDLSDELKNLFNSEAVTIFSLEQNNTELHSRNFRSNNIGEIRVEVSKNSRTRKFRKCMKISRISQNCPKKSEIFFFVEIFFDEKKQSLKNF